LTGKFPRTPGSPAASPKRSGKMKKFEKSFGTVLAVFIAVMALLTACPTSLDNDDDTIPPAPPPVLKVYGTISGLKDPYGRDVKVYRKSGTSVTDTQMAKAIASLQKGYDIQDGSDQINMNTKIVAIYITNGIVNNYYYTDERNLELRYSHEADTMGDILVNISNNSITAGTAAMLKACSKFYFAGSIEPNVRRAQKFTI
jgi:hypothetical protein